MPEKSIQPSSWRRTDSLRGHLAEAEGYESSNTAARTTNYTFAFTPDDRKLLHNSLTTGSAFRLGQENSLFSFRSPVSLPVDSGLAVSPRQENRFRGWKGFRARVGNRSSGTCMREECMWTQAN